MHKFRGKGPQNAGNGISGCLDLKIFRGRIPPDPLLMRGFYKAPVKKKARSAAENKREYNNISHTPYEVSYNVRV